MAREAPPREDRWVRSAEVVLREPGDRFPLPADIHAEAAEKLSGDRPSIYNLLTYLSVLISAQAQPLEA
jgi:hypothetical protein